MLGLTDDYIDYVIDHNPLKHGTFPTSTNIPVYTPSFAKNELCKKKVILFLSW